MSASTQVAIHIFNSRMTNLVIRRAGEYEEIITATDHFEARSTGCRSGELAGLSITMTKHKKPITKISSL